MTGENTVRTINPTAIIGLILLCYASFRIAKEATSRRRAGQQHGAGSQTFWASCIMLFVLPGKDGRVTGCTEPPPESQMDYSLSPPHSSPSPSPPFLCSWLDTLMLFAANFGAVAFPCMRLWNKSNAFFFC